MTVATKEKVKCPNCGKEGIKSLKQHERYCIALHPELAPSPPENEGIDLEKQEDVDKLTAIMKEQPEPQDIPEPTETPQDVVADNNEVRIGKILYSDIVKPLCEEHGIELRAWEEIDQSDYFKIAGRILSAIKGA